MLHMKRIQAFKYRLKTKSKQANILQRIAGSCRYVYNQARMLQIKNYENGGKYLSYATLCKRLTEWKQEKIWLHDSPSQSLQQSLKDLDRGYQNFFKKLSQFPNKKHRNIHDSFRYPQGVKLDQGTNRIFLPKIGWMRYINTKIVLGQIKNVTISKKLDQWYVSIQVEREVEEMIHPARTIVGIDVGVARFATLSNGSVFESLSALKNQQRKLGSYQKNLSRKKKFSQNWKKQKQKIARLHSIIANTRLNYLHQTSTKISKNHAIIVLEDLQVKNMTQSASGTKENPGKSVQAKSGLNRVILDQGWGEFRRQLVYKACWLGGEVVLVNPQYTSLTCPQCQHISKENRKTQSEFKCINCKYENHADLVAAINIERAGHARLACGEMVQQGRSMKQEPARTAAKIAA